MSKVGENHKFIDTGVASETIAGKRFVKFGSAQGGYDICDTAGERAHGVNLFDVTAGQAMSVVKDGLVEVESGDALTLHGPVQTDASGRAIDAASGDAVLGWARASAAAAGEFPTIELARGAYIIP